jgi:hypothetical protein
MPQLKVEQIALGLREIARAGALFKPIKQAVTCQIESKT